jgi:uncharacterized protein YndB with AHSA1/START domain
MSDLNRVVTADTHNVITRVVDAPRDRVFRAWTEPAEIAAWYGPDQFETPPEHVHIDPRVGGRWELKMIQRGGGMEFAIGYEIIELVEPELIVLRSDPWPGVGTDEPMVPVLRVELEDLGDRTRLTISDGPYPTATALGGARAAWNASLDKLATLVKE